MLTTPFDRYLFLDPIVEQFCHVFHLNNEMMRLAIVLIGQYPLCLILRYKLNTTFQRHLFALFTGLVLSFFTFRWDTLHYVFSSLGLYLICKLFSSQPKKIPLLSMIWCTAYLCYGHWYRYQYEYLTYTVNWATTQMLLTIKLTSFAWSYHDGFPNVDPVAGALKPLVIKKFPSLFEFYSYIFFFPGFNTGPVGFFPEYMAFMDRSSFKDEPNNEIPPTIIPALKRFALSLLGIAGFYLTKLYPESFMATDDYLNLPFWSRVAYLILSTELGFTKYYFAWFNGECSVTLVGFSYNGRDPKTNQVRWDRVNILNFVPFITGYNRHAIPVEWNICSGRWLRYYIYFRLPLSLQKHGVLITHAVSAFWHGFYPGYYYFFFTHWWFHRVDEAFEQAIVKKYLIREDRQTRTTTIINKPGYWIWRTLATLHFFIGLKYWVAPFRVMSLEAGWNVWKSWFFIPHIFLAVVHIGLKIFASPPPPPVTSVKKAE